MDWNSEEQARAYWHERIRQDARRESSSTSLLAEFEQLIGELEAADMPEAIENLQHTLCDVSDEARSAAFDELCARHPGASELKLRAIAEHDLTLNKYWRLYKRWQIASWAR